MIFVHGSFVISYDDFSSIMSEEVKLFEEKVSCFSVLLKLMGNKIDIDMFDLLRNFYYNNVDFLEYDFLDCDSDYDFEKDLEDLYLYFKLEILDKFKEKTNISLSLYFDDEKDKLYFCLEQRDVVDFTPSAKALMNKRINIDCIL